ncbi:hypothetical protein AMTRI_Chr05g61360 [Amborella trichopoda]|uniref:Protein kinase domain-containing protein n=1 Tax=Amborella trichopoda TaxID=13333 RepID=U5DBD5_AMBTC|nr:probable leucine-rich repeat receptor-like protein kinase At1g68400 [Amborella trichopoda]XP_020531676.1 probable leucine-rich repeat receptor-like protein kinase At1g68400 [Amborella trichopoda]ERN19839.1 hypothetical protein AMTR_s00064p00199910 [Amborella trichopoda]|eukprot:XP_006858372.1 probable leucine-rich repeat receptor-like protein kinase At1g68400 [Amborella trichopoda]
MELPFLYLLLLLLFSSCNCDPNPNPDFAPLQAFKSSVDAFNYLSSWDSADPCSGKWLGVNCLRGRVTRLVLQRLNLTGEIHAIAGLSELRVLSLKYNFLSSTLPSLSHWKNMKQLFLSHNHLSGEIPDGISELRRLWRLDLAHNAFSGHLPVGLGRLPRLLTLRLESNSFAGTILSLNLSTLEDFNISGNNFVGVIPQSLSLFPPSSFSGNLDLCGTPLLSKCSNSTVNSIPNHPVSEDPKAIMGGLAEKGDRISSTAVIAIVAVDSIVLFLLGGAFIYCYWSRMGVGAEKREKKGGLVERMVYSSSFHGSRRGEERGNLVFFEGCKAFELDELLRASAEMLGKGMFGAAYKAAMENGVQVVVKRLKERKKDGEEVLQVLGRLRNKNVVSLRACYYSKDETLLVYDFLPYGSLHSFLHGNRGPGRTPVRWKSRLRIALDAARGLAFLHQTCRQPLNLSHGNLTSSNILLSHPSASACISDFALHHLVPHTTPSIRQSPQKKPSQKLDVYGFGIVLLEILTGRPSEESGVSLVEWVQCVVKEEWTSEVFDLELMKDRQCEEEMVSLLQVALLCLSESTSQRPNMSKVVQLIQEICGGRIGNEDSSTTPAYDDSDSSSPLSKDTT